MVPPTRLQPSQSPADSSLETPQKTTLFCPVCDHDSPPDGDWRHEAHGETVAYVCPACETTITTRPQTADDQRTSQLEPATMLWESTVRRTATVWQATVTAGISSVSAFTKRRQ